MCPFTTPAWHLSCHVYNSIKWAFECIINAFFESHRAHCCKRGREVGSVGRKDIGDPSSPPSPPRLISSFKLRFLLSSVFFSSNILRLPFLELFKVLHLPFIPSPSITSIPTCSSCSANTSKYTFTLPPTTPLHPHSTLSTRLHSILHCSSQCEPGCVCAHVYLLRWT